MHKNIRNFYRIVYNKTFISLINFVLSEKWKCTRMMSDDRDKKTTRRYETFSAVLINVSHRIRIQMDSIRRTMIKLTKTMLRCCSALWRFVS